MEFLNFLLSVPSKEVGENNKLYHLFTEDMQNLFKLVEVEDKMLEMKRFDAKKAQEAKLESMKKLKELEEKPKDANITGENN